MSRSARVNIGLVILIALAAFLLMRIHAAGGAKLGNASEGHRLAEAWCKPCHAIEPHMVGLLDQAPSFEAIANRHGTTALSIKVFLKTNHANMPNLVIAPDQADSLASYILSLNTHWVKALSRSSAAPHAQSSDMIDFDQLQRATTR